MSLDNSFGGEKRQSGTRNFERADIVATNVIPYSIIIGSIIILGGLFLAGVAVYNHYHKEKPKTAATARENIHPLGEQK